MPRQRQLPVKRNMAALVVFVLCALLGRTSCAKSLKFPPSFKFGAATSSYQIEGAWNVTDKAPSVWDAFTHEKPHLILDGSSGDVACDSYNLWKQDIRIASELDLNYYRFSISWPRILPTGFTDHISEDGVRYYNNLIDGLIQSGIEPVVTIYHWETPQRLQNLGGWSNPLMTDWYADYAKVLFQLFGDRVKTWITINEPFIMCTVGYQLDVVAPPFKDYDIGNFLCTKNVIMAHAKAWRIYDQEFREKYQGRVGITQQVINLEPYSEDDQELTELALQYYQGIHAHPIFSKDGGWSPVLEKWLERNSIKKGFSKSRLPAFTDEERELAKGAYDFYGLNYYTSRKIRKRREDEFVDEYGLNAISEFDIILDIDPAWKKASNFWFFIHPEGLRKQLNWLKKAYGDIEIYITENGYSSSEYNLHDIERVEFLRDHLEQVLLAIHEDKVNVTRYTVWSLMDNFEWTDGYHSRFGLFEVNFDDPKRPRTARDSARYYKHVISTGGIDVPNKYISDEL